MVLKNTATETRKTNNFQSYALKDLLKEIFSRLGSIEPLTNSTHKLISKSGKRGIFSVKESKIVLPIEFDRIYDLTGSHLLIQKGDKLGIFSTQTLSLVLPVKYDRIAYVDSGLYAVTINEKTDTFSIGTNKFVYK